MTHYGMVIDMKRCYGCHTCAVACKTANNLPKNIWYNLVSAVGSEKMDCAVGTFPELEMKFLPKACQQCASPACVEVCPTGASALNEDGIVITDNELCIGCGACMTACPYDVRVMLEEAPEYYIEGYTFGDPTAQSHVENTVEKCNFCYERIKEGRTPACMELCPGRARFWGDLDDPESDASKALKRQDRTATRLLEEAGTEPSVYYLQ